MELKVPKQTEKPNGFSLLSIPLKVCQMAFPNVLHLHQASIVRHKTIFMNLPCRIPLPPVLSSSAPPTGELRSGPHDSYPAYGKTYKEDLARHETRLFG